MIEIIVVILLCVTNSKNAKARAKSGGAAIAYTLGLWFGCEILGAVFGIAASGGEATAPVYIAALLFAAGGGVASYFIAKSGNVVAQNQMPFYPAPVTPQGVAYPAQQPQQTYNTQQGQALPPYPGTQPVQQSQAQPAQQSPMQAFPAPQVPLPSQPAATQMQAATTPVQSAQPQTQASPYPQAQGQPDQTQIQSSSAQANLQTQAQAQPQAETTTVVFSAKKVMGQFLVSSVTIEVNGIPYKTGFNEPINILAPAGNVQIECYLNYMGKSGVAQTYVTLAPNQTYQLEYKSPMVVTGSGTLNIAQIS